MSGRCGATTGRVRRGAAAALRRLRWGADPAARPGRADRLRRRDPAADAAADAAGQPGGGAVAELRADALHRHLGDLRDRPRRGGHVEPLVRARRGADRRRRAVRRARLHDVRVAAGARRRPPARAAHPHPRRGGDPDARSRRRAAGGARGRAGQLHDRGHPRGGPGPAAVDRLRPVRRPGRVRGAVPLGDGFQQRRLRALSGQPDRVRHRPTDLPARRGRRDPRRARLPGALRAAAGAGQPADLEPAHSSRWSPPSPPPGCPPGSPARCRRPRSTFWWC